jgi:hypothetical protein
MPDYIYDELFSLEYVPLHDNADPENKNDWFIVFHSAEDFSYKEEKFKQFLKSLKDDGCCML